MRIDLSGATLIHLNFNRCHVTDANFIGATFSGDARFGKVTFSGVAGFEKATFSGNAEFDKATFSGNAEFDKATFSGVARFDRATFSRSPDFREATASCEGGHVWPDGWRLQATSATEGHLIEDSAADDSVDGPQEDT